MRAACLAAVLVLAGCTDRLDRDRLVGAVHEAHAHAAEARMLAELRDRGGLPRVFDEVHRSMLGEQIDKLAKELSHRAEDARLDGWREATRGLVTGLSSVVHAGGDTATVTHFEQELQKIDAELAE